MGRKAVSVAGQIESAHLKTSYYDHLTSYLNLSQAAAKATYDIQYPQDTWSLTCGKTSQTSHLDLPAQPGIYIFAQPIECELVTSAAEPDAVWPRICIEVHAADADGRMGVGGYAFHHLPRTAGRHRLTCKLWRPRGSWLERISSFFLGAPPQLRDTSLVYGVPAGHYSDEPASDQGKAGGPSSLERKVNEQRFDCVSEGTVTIVLNVLLRDVPDVQATK